jgi:hypothetical protein
MRLGHAGAMAACIFWGHCYADAMATTKKRTTKPLSPELRALRAELRAAEAKGENPARPLYKALSPEAKLAFWRRHSA